MSKLKDAYIRGILRGMSSSVQVFESYSPPPVDIERLREMLISDLHSNDGLSDLELIGQDFYKALEQELEEREHGKQCEEWRCA